MQFYRYTNRYTNTEKITFLTGHPQCAVSSFDDDDNAVCQGLRCCRTWGKVCQQNSDA